MSKINEKWFYGLVLTFVIVAGFWLSAMQVRAGEIVGTEGAFTHIHVDGCYEAVTLSCESKHTSKVSVEHGDYFCPNCNATIYHHSVIYTWSCPILGVSWQQDCYTACQTCCAINNKWSHAKPGTHLYTEKQLKCGFQENEKTATVKIVADDSWTNEGVNLTAKCDILKQDLSSTGISLSWGDGTYYVTENGSYSVTATNSQGNTVSSSIQISCIDKISPVIAGVSGNETTMTDKGIEVTVTVSDGESGLAEAACSVDGGASWGAATTFWVEEGKNIQFAVRDKAGNVSTATISRSQFPYPPKPVTPPAPANPPAQNTNQGNAVQSGTVNSPENVTEQMQKQEAQEKEEREKKTQEKKTQEKEEQEREREQKAQGLMKQERLTTEEREQAYGISMVLQKRARDEFFTQNKVRQIKKQVSAGNAGEEETTVSQGDSLTAASTINLSDSADLNGDNTGFLSESTSRFFNNAKVYAGVMLCAIAVGSFIYLLWLHSAVLYCYEGGEEYRKIGLFHIKRNKNELELYLPDYILQSTKAFRYRLMLRNRLVKKCSNHDLVVYNEENKLRQQVEECVDFVL